MFVSGYPHNPYNGVICNDTITATGVFGSKELWRLARGKNIVNSRNPKSIGDHLKSALLRMFYHYHYCIHVSLTIICLPVRHSMLGPMKHEALCALRTWTIPRKTIYVLTIRIALGLVGVCGGSIVSNQRNTSEIRVSLICWKGGIRKFTQILPGNGNISTKPNSFRIPLRQLSSCGCHWLVMNICRQDGAPGYWWDPFLIGSANSRLSQWFMFWSHDSFPSSSDIVNPNPRERGSQTTQNMIKLLDSLCGFKVNTIVDINVQIVLPHVLSYSLPLPLSLFFLPLWFPLSTKGGFTNGLLNRSPSIDSRQKDPHFELGGTALPSQIPSIVILPVWLWFWPLKRTVHVLT